MTLEAWIFVVAVFSFLAGVTGTLVTFHYGRKSSRNQEEQLRLQREQSTMVPYLRVSDIVFLDPRSVEEVKDTVEEVEKREQAEEAQRRGGELYDPPIDVTLYDPGVREQRYYYGPVPDAVMVIKLENAGRTAAHNVSGTISMERAPLEILDFPGLDASEVSAPDEAGIVTAEVGTIPEILPGRSGSFRVATVIHLEPKKDVTLKYDFITPAGFPTSGEWVVR